jgi:hypothetical protein
LVYRSHEISSPAKNFFYLGSIYDGLFGQKAVSAQNLLLEQARMMSVHERQEEMWVEPVNLGRRIPEDHLLRRLQKVLILEFVREETAQF